MKTTQRSNLLRFGLLWWLHRFEPDARHRMITVRMKEKLVETDHLLACLFWWDARGHLDRTSHLEESTYTGFLNYCTLTLSSDADYVISAVYMCM